MFLNFHNKYTSVIYNTQLLIVNSKRENKMKKRRLRKRAYVLIGCIIGLILGISIYFITRPAISFNESTQDIEINSTYNPMSFIKKVNGNKSSVKVDDSKVNVHKLGKYKIVYKLNKKDYTLNVEVVDTKKPTFNVENKEIEVGSKVKASERYQR